MSTVPLPRGPIDTPILVEYRLGGPDAVRFITAIRLTGRPELSELSAMVLVANCQDTADLQGLGWFWPGANIHRITARISQRAFRILERLTPPVPLTADDAIVAATATVHKLPLYTLDPGRFAAVPGLSVLQLY
ncbi:MAG TPA: hypothetical protein VKE74_26970 [Gemmataceae bacterium]|nr:hypothetical protein [Gemmataceae bacterium]